MTSGNANEVRDGGACSGKSSLFLLTVRVAPGIGSPGDRGQSVWQSGLIFEPSGMHATPLENRME